MWFRATEPIEAVVWDRARMAAGSELAGPAVIESLESTIIVPPAWAATMDRDGFINLAREQKRTRRG